MAKPGDTVRFLSATGGGRITRIEGNIAYVDEDGFETPVLLKEVVVVMPAGQEEAKRGIKKMFDQEAFDEGKKKQEPVKPEPRKERPRTADETTAAWMQQGVPPAEAEETPHGDRMNIVLAFEPTDVRRLDQSKFNAVLVNDSNYCLQFVLMRRGDGDRGWTVVYQGLALPNELTDLAVLEHASLPGYDRLAFQCVAFKQGKEFTLQSPVSVSRRMDLTKFHKFHCFRPGLYFDSPVLEIPLVSDGVATKPLEVNAAEVAEALATPARDKDAARELAAKYRVDARKGGRKPADNPHKVLPLIEVDLHIGELTDTTAGMEPKDMLEMQLETVRRHMKENSGRLGQKLVFIHGKGDGVLRKAVLSLLRKEFPKAEVQDASFREYGFGASLVTVH